MEVSLLLFIERIIAPIGQGAFYIEKFNLTSSKKINIVFDCGSTSIHTLEQKIKDLFHQEETIDAVFISHFDSDHFNGLKYLLEYTNITNLFLPLLTTETVIANQLKSQLDDINDSFTATFFKDPVATIKYYSPNTQVHQISPDQDFPDENNFDAIKNIEKEINKHVEWNLVPHCFRMEQKASKFIHEFNDVFKQHLTTIDEVSTYLKLHRKMVSLKTLKKIYNSTNCNLNIQTTTLYSGPSFPVIYQDINYLGKNFPAGTLYTGDYLLKNSQYKKQLTIVYKKYLPCVGLLQIPHHGSKHNYSSDFIKNNFHHLYYCFTSVGNKNRYGHPSTCVVDSINKLPSPPLKFHKVTECPFSVLTSYIVV